MKRLVLALALALGLLGALVAPTAAVDISSPTVTESSSDARPAAERQAREPLTKWRCGAWRGHGGIGWRDCAKLTSLKDKIKIDYRERFYNKFRTPGEFVCTHSKTTSWNFGASVTGKVEAGVIFSKVEVSATASVSRSTSTTQGTQVKHPHPGRSWVHCERGIHGFSFRGAIRRQTCDSSGCTFSNYRSFSGTAPNAGFWQYGPGRGGVEVIP